jgi:hypothetical protein
MEENVKRVGLLVPRLTAGVKFVWPPTYPNPLNVSKNKQLFVDNRFIEPNDGITLSMREPIKPARE